jgi:hypothetical protein
MPSSRLSDLKVTWRGAVGKNDGTSDGEERTMPRLTKSSLSRKSLAFFVVIVDGDQVAVSELDAFVAPNDMSNGIRASRVYLISTVLLVHLEQLLCSPVHKVNTARTPGSEYPHNASRGRAKQLAWHDPRRKNIQEPFPTLIGSLHHIELSQLRPRRMMCMEDDQILRQVALLSDLQRVVARFQER